MSPFDKLIMDELATEWRLKYRQYVDSSINNHVVVKQSTIKAAGNGLFSDRIFVSGDIITIYLGKCVRSRKTTTAYKLDFLLWG